MIFGDNPKKISGRKDPLGLNTYTYKPNIDAIRQSRNLYAYCINNPLMYSDPDGEFALLASIFFGAFVGAIIGAGVDALGQLMSGKSLNDLDWQSIAISAGSGAISGGLAGSGIGLGYSVAANSVLSGATTVVRQTMYGENIDWNRVAIDTGIGAIAGRIGGFGAQYDVNKAYYQIQNFGTSFQSVLKVTYKSPIAALTVKKELAKSTGKMTATGLVISVSDRTLTIVKVGKR